MQNELFIEPVTDRYILSNGDVLQLPIQYAGGTAMLAAFTASAARVRELLPSDHLRPVQVVPGKAVVVFAALEYPDCSQSDGTPITPYNEFIVGIPVLYEPAYNLPALPLVMPDRFKTFGLYIHQMPVTEPLPRDGGIEIWGYPKFLAEITFTETVCTRRVALRADGRDILYLELAKMATRPRHTRYFTYTVKDDQIVRTVFDTTGEGGSVRFRGGAWFTLGDHPIAEELRWLRLGRVALERSYTTRMRATLHPPMERLGRVAAHIRRTALAAD
jgi:hypothetical protein